MRSRIFRISELAILRSRLFRIANLSLVWECKKIDEQDIENRIVIDGSGAEKYEFIHESCVFSLLFFQPNSIETEMAPFPVVFIY